MHRLFLHVHRTRAHPVLVNHAFSVEVNESRSFLHVRQHCRLTHLEPAVLSTSAPTVGEHLQERVLVDVVVTFAQSFGAVFVGGSETIVRLTTQPHEPVTGLLHLEQTRYPLIVRTARLTARLVADPRSIGESTAHVFVPMVVATLERQPFGAVPEVMFSLFRGHEGVDGLGGQGQIGGVCIHLAVLKKRALQVPVDEVVIELQHAHFGVL